MYPREIGFELNFVTKERTSEGVCAEGIERGGDDGGGLLLVVEDCERGDTEDGEEDWEADEEGEAGTAEVCGWESRRCQLDGLMWRGGGVTWECSVSATFEERTGASAGGCGNCAPGNERNSPD